MIKGIYNENEFYTNHYWATKYFDELKSKIQNVPNLKEKIDQLKSISVVYWDLADAKDISSSEKNDLFESFYQKLFEILGHAWLPTKRQTLDGRYYTPVSETKKDSKSHVILALTDQKETGSFENIPYQLSKLDFDEQEEADDRELTEIVSEELESETGPKWFILGSLDGLFLIERTKWAYGRFIRINFTEVFSQKDEDVYTSLIGLFSRDVLAPDSGISIHSELDDNSHRYAFAVTTELREGVREAIELLINEMIYAKREAKQEFLKKGKESNEYAKELSHDALFYVYRLIFLLFLESQGEDSELLPLKSEIYRHGYMLEKLLEVTFRKIHEGTQEYEGTFIQESLERIFDLIYNGFAPQKSADLIARELSATGFLVNGLKSDLFDPEKVKHLKGVTLRNGVLQKILQKLSMADMKEGKKIRKARVSYANLGINQLGAVYEGLLSYTGFFAQEDLYELTQVKKGKDEDEDTDDTESDESKPKAQRIDPDKVYLAPKSLVEKYKKDKKYKLTEKHFVLDPETGEPVIYKKGSFMFRMAGRDRQKLASFYTPESLTKCTVKYALKVLFENKKTLDELKKVKILEPAMGSGAFLNEAVNQLADKIYDLEYLEAKIKPKLQDRQKRIWNIKYDLISNNVYGVDLNLTAIELARFSLWLNCIGAGKEPPRFENRLKVGNSLIGARFKKNADGIYPWLMLDQGMMDYGKKLSEYNEPGAKKIKEFRDSFLKSEVEINDGALIEAQEKVEEAFNCLIEGNNPKENYEKLKICCDLWSSLFFLNSEDILGYPKNHKGFLDIIISILSGSVSAEFETLKESLSRISTDERFFHWEIEFPNEIASGGFDLIMGNPPWVAVEWQDALFVSDYNVIPGVLKLDAGKTRKFVTDLADKQVECGLISQLVRTIGYSKMLELPFYNLLLGVPKNTYKAFIILSISLLKNSGSVGLIHEDGVYEGSSGGPLKFYLYSKLKFHFQFQNEYMLFAEVGHAKKFSINIFDNVSRDIGFKHIGSLFHPLTIEECFTNTNEASIPSPRDMNGKWQIKGHPKRVVDIDLNYLKLFSSIQGLPEDVTPPFLNIYSQPLLIFTRKLSENTQRVKDFAWQDVDLSKSIMIHETDIAELGYITQESRTPKSISDLILSAPQVDRYNPFSKQTKIKYEGKHSYENVNLDEVGPNFYPRTQFQIIENKKEALHDLYRHNERRHTSFNRIVFRRRVSPNAAQCLFGAILPKGPLHLNTLSSFAIENLTRLPVVAGFTGSLLFQSIVRLRNLQDAYPESILEFPFPTNSLYFPSIARRVLALNAVSNSFKEIWEANSLLVGADTLSNEKTKLFPRATWSPDIFIKDINIRNLAEDEIDILVGISFGLSKEEILQMYTVVLSTLAKTDCDNTRDRVTNFNEAYNFFEKRGW